MTKQISIPQDGPRVPHPDETPKFRRVKSGPRDWAVAVAAILTVLLLLAIVLGLLAWTATEVWQQVLSNI